MLLAWDGAYKNTRRVGSAGTAVALAAAFLVAGAGMALYARLAGVCGRLSAGTEASCANARACNRCRLALGRRGGQDARHNRGCTPVAGGRRARGSADTRLRRQSLPHGRAGRPCAVPRPRSEVGDEAAELRLALPDVPIAVGKWRVQMAHAAIARWSPNALVLDDGFQHLPLARTLDLVLLPAESPLGNGYCLPAGPLREPPDGLQRAGGVIWVYFDSPHPQSLSHEVGEGCRGERRFALRRLPPRLRAGEGDKGDEGFLSPTYTAAIAPTALLRLATGERLSLDTLREQPLTIVCGIARPQRFLQMANLLGYTVAEAHTFPDHHAYTPDKLYRFSGKTLLTTLKDAVKLRGRLPDDCDAYALLIEAHLDDALRGHILSLFTGTPAGSRES
jgi:tetraacyldisaccharide-1-P 4'-kinase